jgi:hypothetical protein
MPPEPPCRDVVVLGAGASMAGGLPTALGFTVIDPDADEVIARIQTSFSAEFIARTQWRPYRMRFDDETPKWAPQNIFRGAAIEKM